MSILTQPSDDVPRRCQGCDWGWRILDRTGRWTVKPCERHQPELYDLWVAGKFRPVVPAAWTEAA